MEPTNPLLECYCLTSIAKVDAGICMKYRKHAHCRELRTMGQPLLASVLQHAILLVTELYNCYVESSESEMRDMTGMVVPASDDLTINAKILHLKNNSVLTLYMNIQEGSETATGYFWQFPVRTGTDAIYVSQEHY